MKKNGIFCQNNKRMNTTLKQLFLKHGSYLTRKDIPERSLYYQLLKLVHTGKVIRLKQGVFCLEEEAMNRSMVDIERIVPGGVLCLYSAWAYYELTTQIPQSYNVAIDKDRKIILPEYPSITLYYWKKEYQELGVQNCKIGDINIRIYDLEKSVCDAIKYRTKIGIDVSSEILKNYLSRKDRNITLLIRYASSMRIAKTLKKYLEIQL